MGGDMTVEFEFEVPADKLTVRVVIYPTLAALNEAAPHDERIGAVVERDTHRRYGDDDAFEVTFKATMRFCKERLGGGVVAHEATHVAVLAHNGTTITCDNDEPFAATVGEVVRHVYLGLRDHGLIDS